MMMVYWLGVVFTGAGLFMLQDVYKYRKHGREFRGVVIGHKEELEQRDNSGGALMLYYPIIKYSYLSKEYEFISDSGASVKHQKVGDSVEVLVLEDDHDTARVKSQMRLFLAYTIAIVGPMTVLWGLSLMQKDVSKYALIAVISVIVLYFFLKFFSTPGQQMERPSKKGRK